MVCAPWCKASSRPVLDGRNRLAACQIAGIEPRFATIKLPNPEDAREQAVRSRIISLNNERRHLTKSQRAMALAMMYPDSDKKGRGNEGAVESILNVGFSADYVRKSRAVLRYSPGIADQVMAGRLAVSDAYDKVRSIIDQAEEKTEVKAAAEPRTASGSARRARPDQQRDGCHQRQGGACHRWRDHHTSPPMARATIAGQISHQTV